MNLLKTITTIELSSICNLECRYCINRLLVKHPARNPGIMSDEVFEQSLKVLEVLCRRGTQKEVNMNGNGESCLDPKLCDRIRAVREIVGDRQVALSTNGLNMTPELAKNLKDSGIDRVDISPHSPFHVRRAVIMMSDAGLVGIVNMGPMIMSHNYAGQLEPENSIEVRFDLRCDPLLEGRGYIQSEGNVTPCCFDYRNLGVFGTVFDEDLFEREIRPFELCKTCHQGGQVFQPAREKSKRKGLK